LGEKNFQTKNLLKEIDLKKNIITIRK